MTFTVELRRSRSSKHERMQPHLDDRVRFLRAFPTLSPAPIERFEALEQLRALWHGFRIVVEITDGTPAPGVDTPEDLERVRALFAAAKPLTTRN